MKKFKSVKGNFRDMKISKKLITSFITISLVSVIIGVIGIVGMIMINNADTKLYEVQTKPLADYSSFNNSLIEMRVYIREAVINSGDNVAIENAESNFNTHLATFREKSKAYGSTINSKESKALFE